VHIGETARFTATASYSDGSARDVTSEANWQVASEFLSLTGPGEVIGSGAGESAVSAAFSGRSSVVGGVVIVPPGTYHMRGTVRDAGKPLSEATVVITSGPLGTKPVNLVNGVYKVFGVAGPTTIAVSKEGYQTATREITVTSHATVDIDMVLRGSRPDISGGYTLTFTAAPECTSLPEYARSREYAATVSQSGADVEVHLAPAPGTRFIEVDGRRLDHFGGIVGATSVQFDLSRTPPDFYYRLMYPPIFQVVGDNRLFGVDGSAVTTIFPDRLEGPLSGTFTTTGSGIPTQGCDSMNHRLRLTK
jgi:hypothetical protein